MLGLPLIAQPISMTSAVENIIAKSLAKCLYVVNAPDRSPFVILVVQRQNCRFGAVQLFMRSWYNM